MTDSPTQRQITVRTGEPFTPTWNRIPGIEVDGARVSIDPDAYFYRHSAAPTWLLVDWDLVVDRLLGSEETETAAVEQQALEFVHRYGRRTSDPADVLETAELVYGHLFDRERLTDPDLSEVTEEDLRILRESATLAALNRVEPSGEITDIGPCWFFPATARVVFDLDEAEGDRIDGLYHGGFFNEYRRRDAIKAHAALGGRLVHACQSSANMSGGAVLPYGADLERFRSDLGAFKAEWIGSILALRAGVAD
ncbi:hypothetical protein [Pseudofrankia sp. BMG5.37]|uniref:hypothetical protein n=1 Tax=Pseudofrankia sp. BMG5.37 TaxID=3050035 RepID=UPI00289443E0|nr:hypothetical protein [Pseudofrankia sp. BMG5.37]MDT3440977.1 hypothetical protein [Pseudofrankia sp. BMG5.37]